MRGITAVAVLLCVLVGCADPEEETTGPTTTVTTTTLPPSNTTTTVPPRSVTEVDVCGLLRPRELEAVLDDPGRGETSPADEREPPGSGGVPALISDRCSWPSLDAPRLVLAYLAPTTASDGPQHLQDVIEAGTGFAEGGRIIPQQAGAETVGVLIDEDEMVRELAVVKRSALLYLLLHEDLSARDTEAVASHAELLVTALSRAPR